jgi:SAM-dependent methyltransferase
MTARRSAGHSAVMGSERYTHGHHESVLRAHRWRTAANSAAYLLAHLRPGMAVLDVGSGPGTITVDLGHAVGDGTVVGVDTVESVVEQASAYAAGSGTQNVSFAVGDVYALDFADGTFDVAHAHQVLQHLGDPVAALAEMRRVCRPGGLVAVRDADYGAMTWYPRVPGLDSWMAMYHEVSRGNGGEPDAARYLDAWAGEAGLADIRVSASTWEFSSAEDVAWWSAVWADRVTRSDLADQAVAAGVATREQLEEMAEAFGVWADHPGATFTVPHREVLARA